MHPSEGLRKTLGKVILWVHTERRDEMDEDFFFTWSDVEDVVVEDDMNALIKDHRVRNVPTLTVLFTRGFPTYTETMWVHGYASAKTIVVSYVSVQTTDGKRIPGLIRSIPIGWRDLASADTFRACFEREVESLARDGWVRKPHTVYSADPWDETSVLDEGPTF